MDHYVTLGIQRSASAEEIKKAFKEKAKKYHPDRNSDPKAPKIFSSVKLAYDTLSDPTRKRKYDIEIGNYRSDPNRIHNAYHDIFQEFIYGRRHSTSANRNTYTDFSQEQYQEQDVIREPGEDIDVSISITLQEAAKGCIREVKTKTGVLNDCPTCNGSQCIPGTGKIVCTRCFGKGTEVDYRIGPGPRDRTCRTCYGSGYEPKHPCSSCNGKGKVNSARRVKVRVPAGIEDKQKLRVAGMGAPGVGHKPGDLYVTVHVKIDKQFNRHGSNITINKPIDFVTAIRGGMIDVEVLGGPPIKVQIPKNSSSNEEIIVKGAGMPDPRTGNRGNLCVTIHVKNPDIKTPRAQRLLDELLDEIMRSHPR